jgi:succinate dehydrogenase flavin-adding protein (antitoxin of CptAB toxin-antitoxin module)
MSKKPLSTSDEKLVNWIHNHHDSMTLVEMADILGSHYVSKNYNTLTSSHLSNFCRKDLGLRKVRNYWKPNYQGKNWHAFV